MELGCWTIKGRVAYIKLMLYHNILRSDKRRVLRKLLKEQEKEARETTWLACIKMEIERYSIELNPEETLKVNVEKGSKKED